MIKSKSYVEPFGHSHWTRPEDGKQLPIRRVIINIGTPTNNEAHQVTEQHLIPFVYGPGLFSCRLYRNPGMGTATSLEQIHTLAPIKWNEFTLTLHLPADLAGPSAGDVFADIEYTEETPEADQMPYDGAGIVPADQIGIYPFIHFIRDVEVIDGGVAPVKVVVEAPYDENASIDIQVDPSMDQTFALTLLGGFDYLGVNVFNLMVYGQGQPPSPVQLGQKYRIDLIATLPNGFKARRSFHVTVKPAPGAGQ